MPNKKKLYDALVKEGYNNFENEDAFNAYVESPENRKTLYNALVDEGFDNFEDESAFHSFLGYGESDEPRTSSGGVGKQEEADAIFEANAERYRQGLPIQRVTTQSVLDAQNKVPDSEILRLKGIMGKAQRQIDEASFFDRFFDEETRTAVATRNKAEEALEMYDEANREKETWFDRNVVGALKGFADKVGDLSTWDFGASGVASAVALKDAVAKMEAGEKLSSAEQNLLDAYGLASAVQAAYQDKVGMAYNVGGSLPESMAFGASLALNPVGSVGKKIGEAAAKAAVKKYGTTLASKLAKGAARVGGDVLEMGVATAVPGAGRVAEDYYNRLNGQSTFDIDENGIVRYGGQVQQEEADNAIWKAMGSQFIENYSEAMGNYFAPMGQMLSNLTSKGLKAAHLGKFAEVLSDVSSSQFSKGLQRFKQATKFDGLVGEYLEEVAGNVMNAATVGDMNFNSPEDHRSVFNPETNIETFLSCALLSGTMYAVEAPVSIYNKNVSKKNLNKADTEAKRLWGDRWDDMRSQMDEADPQLLAQLLTGVQNATDLSDEQKQAAKDYGMRLMQYQGYNARRMQNVAESTSEANAINNAYDEGSDLQTPADKHQTKLAVDRAEAALGEDAAFVQTVMNGAETPVATINAMAEQGYSDEQIQKAKDYYSAMNRMNGMTDALLDEVDSQIESANVEVDMNTNKELNQVIKVVLRDGRQGYVVNGTVTANEEGAVDVNHSDSEIVVRFENGDTEMMNPNKDLQSVAWIDSPAKLKENNNTVLRQSLIDKGIQEIDWNPATPNPKVGDSFEMDGIAVTIVGHDGHGGMFVLPSEEWQAAQGSEQKQQAAIAKAQQMGVVQAGMFKQWTSDQLDAQEEAQAMAEAEAVAEEVVAETQPTEEVAAQTGVAPVEEAKLEKPVIPTKEDGSVDFVAYGKEGSFKILGEKYGEKMPRKVEVTANALADDLAKAQKKLDKAIEEYDNAPIGREEKAEEARDKAQEEYDAIKREADFWASLYAEIKEAQVMPGTQPLQAEGTGRIEERPEKADGGIVGENGAVPEGASGNEIEDSRAVEKAQEVLDNIKQARKEVDTNPTEAQKEAGNYKKGHIKIDGFDITIENPKGGVRSGTDKNGKEWSITMNNDYGYIRGTEAVDGDHIDVFLSSFPTQGSVFVVDQSNEDGSFDESKVMYGFSSLEEARAAYLSNYEKGWESRIMAITEVSKEEFKKWIDSSHRKTKAFSEYKSVKAEEQAGEPSGNNPSPTDEQAEGIGSGTPAESETSQASQPSEVRKPQIADVFAAAEKIDAEEKRRRPLRARANEWAKALGVKVHFIERVEDVKSANVRKALKNGNKVAGWYSQVTGEVFFLMPNLDNVDEIDNTYVHEVVAHKGMFDMLGKERYDALCDKVWEMMPKSEQDKFIDYPGVNGNTRIAADEYIAHLSESLNLSPEQQGIWDKIVQFFRELFDQKLNGILSKSNITKEDISNLIKASYANLKSGAEGVRGEGTRFSAKKKRALETVSTSKKKHQQTVISSADGAKILNNLDNLAEKYENDTHTKEKTFIGEVAKAIEARKQGSGSQYATFETVNGNVVTIRLADHNATVSNFDNRGENEGISIVVSAKDNNGITNDGDAHIVEYFYDSIDLRRADGKPLAEIVKSIKQSLYSGEYKDTTGLAERQEVNESRFRVTFSQEEQSIIGRAKADGTYMKAPNGRQTNLTEKQWAQVRTKAFKKWFGDWENDAANASKVVDENGEPMVVRHRTPNEFNEFSKEKIGSTTDYGAFGLGFYFSPSDFGAWNYGHNMIDAFLNLKNPLVLNNSNAFDVKEPFYGKDYKWGKSESEKFTEWIKENGYDGVHYDYDGKHDEMVAFEPNQIKSATDNVGTFDEGNNDIRFRVTPEHKQHQMDIINETNPAPDDVHTWIRSVDDVKSFEEALDDSDYADYKGEDLDPSYTWDMVEDALETGKVTVYSSYPIKNGVFVTPSYMEAQSYGGTTPYMARVNLEDVAWIDPTQGQLATDNKVSSRKAPSGVRFRFIGEKGAANLDKAEEATTRLDNLAVAREMESAEKDAKAIKMATGWERGADGLWRYETMDSETAIKDGDEAEIRKQIEDIEEEEKDYKKKARAEGIDADEREKAYVDFYRRRSFLEAQLAYVLAKKADVLTHISTRLYNVLVKGDVDNLFDAYPQLETVRVGFATEIVGKALGATVINGSRIEAIDLDVKKSTPEELNGYLAHEIQHAIQEIEGFAPGGDPSMESPAKVLQKEKNISFMQNKLDKSIADRDALIKERDMINNKMSQWWDSHENATREEMLSDKEMQEYNREYDEISKKIDDADEKVKFNQRWLEATWQADTTLGYKRYKSLAGEVEARNVTSRIGMSLEQRRETLASETEDVAREDQIFLKDGIESGIRFRISDKARKLQDEADKFTSKYNSKPVVVIDSNMTDKELERLVGFEAKEVRDAIEFGLNSGYNPKTDKIYIVTDNVKDSSDLEDSLFHENLHQYLLSDKSLVVEFFTDAEDAYKKNVEQIKKEGYKAYEVPEELFVRVVADSQVKGNFAKVFIFLSEEGKEKLTNLLKENGYDIARETEIRTSGRMDGSGRDGSGRRNGDDFGRVAKESSSVASPSKVEKNGRAREIRQLFDQVADMGLDGVLENRYYGKLLMDIYQEMPLDVRRYVSTSAVNKYGGDFVPAMSDYLNVKATAEIWGKVVGFIRDVLRKVGFDLELNQADVKYMLWRSQKPMKKYSAFDVAEDIDARRKFGVDGDSGVRFSVKNAAPFDPSDKRNEIVKEYDAFLKKGKFNFIEAFQDRMYSVKVFMDMIVGATGKKVRDFENAYVAENQLGSVNKPAEEKYLKNFYKPLVEAVKALSEKYGRESVERYIYCKSGLERNEVLRQRDADEAFNAAKEELDDKLAKGQLTQPQYDALLQQAEDQRQQTLSEDVDYSGIRGMWYNIKAQAINKEYEEGRIDKSTRDARLATLEANRKTVVQDWKQFAENQVAAIEGRASSAELKDLWKKINAATNETLRMDYESGMIDKATYDAEKNMMKYYVPLRNWADTTAEEMYEYRSELVRPVSSNQKRAKGRESQADNPIATIALMAQNAIVRGNRNKVKQKFYAFVANRETGLASVRDVWYVKDPTTDTWEAKYADTTNANDAAEFAQILDDFETDMQLLESQGLAYKGKLPLGMKFRASRQQKQAHVVPVMINGKEYAVYVNGNPRPAQAMNGETNSEAANASAWYDKIKRIYGAGLTSWNPDFIIPNMIRDGIHASTMTFLDAGPIAAARFALNGPRAFGQVFAMISGFGKGLVNPQNQAYFEEFVANGGETGYTAIHTLEDYKKEYDKLMNEVKGLKGNFLKKGFQGIAKFLEATNRIFEDVNRFNAYVSARESGESIMRSISAAKNITVNFNRKGALSSNNTAFGTIANAMSKWILFFNPAVQGIAQLVTKTKVNPKRAAAMASSILASGFFMPMLNEMLVAANGGDDEDDYWNQSDFKRRNNWLFFTGDGYASVPLPPVLRELYGIGDIIYGSITGHITPQRAVMDMARQVQSAVGFVNLIPEVSQEPNMVTWAKGFAPDIAAPVLDVISNTNFMGRPIAKWTDFNEYEPEYARVYKGVSPQWVELSKLLNKVGGDEGRRSDVWGNFINPAMMEHLFTNYGGGIGKTINNLAGMALDGIEGNTENLDLYRKIPIVPRFYIPNDEKTVVPAINRKYYDYDYMYNVAKKALKTYQDGVRSKEHPEWKKYIDEMQKNGELEFIRFFEHESKRLTKMQNLIKGNPTNKKELEEKMIDLKADIATKCYEMLK